MTTGTHREDPDHPKRPRRDMETLRDEFNRKYPVGTIVTLDGQTRFPRHVAAPARVSTILHDVLVHLDACFGMCHVPNASISRVGEHPLAPDLAALPKPQTESPEFRLPLCPNCQVQLTIDRDLSCPSCWSRWSLGGDPTWVACVEGCGNTATVVGADHQNRCSSCQAATIMELGHMPRTSPYTCSACGEDVLGIPRDSPARVQGICGRCCEKEGW